jgi:hypothetical protein
MMVDLRRAALYASILSTTTSLVFFLTGVVSLPVPLYLPLDRRWSIGTVAGEPSLSMDYFGRSLIALGVAGIVTGAVALTARSWHRPGRATISGPTTKTLRLGLAYVVTAFVLCASLFAYKLYGREAVLTELPSDPLH